MNIRPSNYRRWLRHCPLVSLPGPSEADAQVQGPVASALEGLSGESVNLEMARPQPLGLSNFNSITMPIGAQVSPKIKAKIWANEFVEFGLLINPTWVIHVTNCKLTRMTILCQPFL